MTKEVKETARQRRARTSKFKAADPNNRKGNFEIQGLFYGNDQPDKAPFPNLAAALSRFERLSTNPNLSVLKLIEFIPVLVDGKPSNQMRVAVLHQLNKTNQTFANSKVEIFYARPNSKEVFGRSAIEKSPALLEAFVRGELEVRRYASVGGNPWWEARA